MAVFISFLKKQSQMVSKKESEKKSIAPAELKTYPADCRKIAAVDSNKHDWD